jgi:hypothetical protein
MNVSAVFNTAKKSTKSIAASRIVDGKHIWKNEIVGAYVVRRCARCALVMERATPVYGKTTYARGGKTIAVLGKNDKQPPCK